MLGRDEAVDLLSFAASYDGRKPNASTVAAWMDASERGRWNFDDAVTAVKEHYARTTDWIMPGHITTALRARQQLPEQVAEHRRQLGAAPADADHVRGVARAWEAARAESRRVSAARRARVLACPDLADRVCAVLGLDDIRRWSGWIPPRTVQARRGEVLNDSPIRRELVAIDQEAADRAEEALMDQEAAR